MKEKTEQEMLHLAAAYCSGTERCVSEVRKKIESASLPEEATQRIIDRLIAERFIDEARYVRYFVNDKLRFNKWGRIKINYELQKKRIDSGLRQEALSAIDETEYRQTLLALLRAKSKGLKAKNDYDKQLKLMRFGAGRGFESQLISSCLKQLIDDVDETLFDME